MQKLIEFDQALTALLASTAHEPKKTSVDLSECLGRILAEDVASSIDIPGFDNSQVDGYAARSSELQTNIWTRFSHKGVVQTNGVLLVKII